MMNSNIKSTRMRERIKRNLPAQVLYHLNQADQWVEITHVTEFSQNGAGLELSHPVEVGRLIHLSFPLPRNLRSFDHQQEQYGIWTVIRDVQLLERINSDSIRIKVGTAFIGKNPPASFFQDITTRYDLKPVLMKNNLWDLRECPRNVGRYVRQEESRHLISEEVYLNILNEQGEIIEHDEAETQNISESGAAVLTKCNIRQGQFILLKSNNQPISLLAIVRGCRQAEENTPASIINLEFISGKWQF